MRKFLAVYLVLATVVLGGLTAIGQTLDMNSISQLTRAKQMAKQEKVDYVVNTLASQPVQQAMQKAGINLSEERRGESRGFRAAPRSSTCFIRSVSIVNQSMALGQYRSTAGIRLGHHRHHRPGHSYRYPGCDPGCERILLRSLLLLVGSGQTKPRRSPFGRSGGVQI